VGPLPFACNIDIRRTPAASRFKLQTSNICTRDTVKYKEVMKHYRQPPNPPPPARNALLIPPACSLGPNGGIVTSLNLFASRRVPPLRCVFVACVFAHCIQI
jgi:hypothetical protein